MARGIKQHNVYAAQLGPLYDDVPKAVLAAIAVSALTVGGDYLELARQRIATEWAILHDAGIVPQPVPTRHADLIDRDSHI